MRVWGESIRYVLKKSGIGVSVICPGFVVSRMTAQAPFKMPFLMTSARASKIIRNGLARNKARIAFPIPTKAAVWFGGLLPGSWTARLLGAPRSARASGAKIMMSVTGVARSDEDCHFIWFVSRAAAPPCSLPYFSKASRPPAA